MSEHFTIETVSGMHPFDPEHLRGAIEFELHTGGGDPDGAIVVEEQFNTLMASIRAGRCARCFGEFTPRVIPSGSRETPCRCIPVCSECGEREALMMRHTTIDWPISHDEEDEVAKEFGQPTLAEILGYARVGFLDLEHNALITDEGVTLIDHKPTTGGWAEFGEDAV